MDTGQKTHLEPMGSGELNRFLNNYYELVPEVQKMVFKVFLNFSFGVLYVQQNGTLEQFL